VGKNVFYKNLTNPMMRYASADSYDEEYSKDPSTGENGKISL
jgi:hypothetical protein